MLKYIGKRLLTAIVSLFVLSIIAFTTIVLPPGDFVTAYVAQLRSQSGAADEAERTALVEQYGLREAQRMQFEKYGAVDELQERERQRIKANKSMETKT